MSWLLFYLLAALHPVLFLVIAWKCNTWKQRLLLWALLPLPAVWYCWDYYVIKNEHAQMCAAEGGLKVLIQPVKVDRVRLVGVELRDASRDILAEYYPRLQAVEALAGKYDGTDGRGQPYVIYTVAKNPRAGLSMDKYPWKEPALIYPSQVVESPDRAWYEISVYETNSQRSTIKEMRLSKDGKVYAKYTDIVHWWTGIQYPDALPTWRCPGMRNRPPENEPNAPKDKWDYVPPYNALTELLLK
jgi:hypothetical protein